jgi:hypothetical protein
MFDLRTVGTTWSVPVAEVADHERLGHPAVRPRVLVGRAERPGPGAADAAAAVREPGARRGLRAAGRPVRAPGPLLRAAVLAEPRAAGGADAGRLRRPAEGDQQLRPSPRQQPRRLRPALRQRRDKAVFPRQALAGARAEVRAGTAARAAAGPGRADPAPGPGAAARGARRLPRGQRHRPARRRARRTDVAGLVPGHAAARRRGGRQRGRPARRRGSPAGAHAGHGGGLGSPGRAAAPAAADAAAAVLREPDPGRDRRTSRHLADAGVQAAGALPGPPARPHRRPGRGPPPVTARLRAARPPAAPAWSRHRPAGRRTTGRPTPAPGPRPGPQARRPAPPARR